MIENRERKHKNNFTRTYEGAYFEKEKTRLLAELAAQFPEKAKEMDGHFKTAKSLFEEWLVRFNDNYWLALKVDVDKLPFSRKDTSFQWASPQWSQIGRNLQQLAHLLGISDMDRAAFDDNRADLNSNKYQVDSAVPNDNNADPNNGNRQGRFFDYGKGVPNIIAAFGDAVKWQPTDLIQLQTFIQAQSITIQRQEQVITALRFRYLMEHLPDRTINPHMKESERWREFWKNAIKSAYGTGKGPLVKLMEGSFNEVEKKFPGENEKDFNKRVEWLQNAASKSQRAFALYGVLSEVIHNYNDGEFTINPLTYSPDDTAILRCLMPDPIHLEKGEVSWTFLRRQYYRLPNNRADKKVKKGKTDDNINEEAKENDSGNKMAMGVPS
ncbi:hypothetical protein F4777DRAFT_563685 [Nemania sp. FL0916]|nr:hypothetical protein F4777DRAFT_563685 [Nemania sp. FL0916]